ncbi:MAG: purine nucleoside permease [Thermomicrobiales bacterium]
MRFGFSATTLGHVRRFWQAGTVVLLILAGTMLGLGVPSRQATLAEAEPGVIAPKVLTVTMFQTGDPLTNGSGEASVWVQNDKLDNLVPIPGGYSPLYCNANYDHCLIITGVLASNAAASIMAVGLSDRVDLSRTYIMVAGIGGGPPDRITVGAAAWATWIVSGDLVTELDAREMPDTWQFPKASLGCAEQWCPDGFRAGNEVFALDPEMTAWAYALSKDVPLADDPKARQAMQNYPDAVARGAPFVTTCAILGVNDFIHGTLMSEWSSWWVSQWTDGKDAYCMSGDEEGGIFTSLQRLEEAKRIDMRRVMALRVATDIDRQYPGQSAGESLAEALDSTFGFVGLENIYRVGSPVVQDIVAHWDQWEAGPPPLPR